MISVMLRQHLAEKINLGEVCFTKGLEILESYNNNSEIKMKYFKSYIYINTIRWENFIKNQAVIFCNTKLELVKENCISIYTLRTTFGLVIRRKVSNHNLEYFDLHRSSNQLIGYQDDEEMEKAAFDYFQKFLVNIR